MLPCIKLFVKIKILCLHNSFYFNFKFNNSISWPYFFISWLLVNNYFPNVNEHFHSTIDNNFFLDLSKLSLQIYTCINCNKNTVLLIQIHLKRWVVEVTFKQQPITSYTNKFWNFSHFTKFFNNLLLYTKGRMSFYNHLL